MAKLLYSLQFIFFVNKIHEFPLSDPNKKWKWAVYRKVKERVKQLCQG